jgi:hypothetical protein
MVQKLDHPEADVDQAMNVDLVPPAEPLSQEEVTAHLRRLFWDLDEKLSAAQNSLAEDIEAMEDQVNQCVLQDKPAPAVEADWRLRFCGSKEIMLSIPGVRKELKYRYALMTLDDELYAEVMSEIEKDGKSPIDLDIAYEMSEISKEVKEDFERQAAGEQGI